MGNAFEVYGKSPLDNEIHASVLIDLFWGLFRFLFFIYILYSNSGTHITPIDRVNVLNKWSSERYCFSALEALIIVLYM